jgi:cell wall-associated NlpC family hydrolase
MTAAGSVIAVPVAGGWRSPDAPRAVDGPALDAAPDVRAWLAAMDDDARRDLVGRLETQLLLGERVRMLEVAGQWARVAVPDQPASADGSPYECWVVAAHVATEARAATPLAADRVATVISPTATLALDNGRIEVSFGTSLPAIHVRGTTLRVALPRGGTATLESATVAVHAPGDPALPATAASIIDRATAFVGLPYLWAGRSGFGFDCSGLVQLVHRVHGVTLPRDTGPMSAVGALVDPEDRAPGDLVFFERNGDVHHVVTWIGGGLVVESPKTGLAARVIALADLPYASEVTVTRRVLPG